jgi:predicted RNase H-like nuclease (RuvC/YqgF family)
VSATPSQVEGLQPAVESGWKRTAEGKFQSHRRTKAQEQRAKAAEAAAREQASHDVAASTQRPAAELTTLKAQVERLKKENEKLKKQAEYMGMQLESERQRSRNKEERVKELRAAAVESDIVHAAQLAKVSNKRDSFSRTIRRYKAQSSSVRVA